MFCSGKELKSNDFWNPRGNINFMSIIEHMLTVVLAANRWFFYFLHSRPVRIALDLPQLLGIVVRHQQIRNGCERTELIHQRPTSHRRWTNPCDRVHRAGDEESSKKETQRMQKTKNIVQNVPWLFGMCVFSQVFVVLKLKSPLKTILLTFFKRTSKRATKKNRNEQRHKSKRKHEKPHQTCKDNQLSISMPGGQFRQSQIPRWSQESGRSGGGGVLGRVGFGAVVVVVVGRHSWFCFPWFYT